MLSCELQTFFIDDNVVKKPKDWDIGVDDGIFCDDDADCDCDCDSDWDWDWDDDDCPDDDDDDDDDNIFDCSLWWAII